MHEPTNPTLLAGAPHVLQSPAEDAQRRHEIALLRVRIARLEPTYAQRPRTLRQIRDCERQIRERGGVPSRHTWFPPAPDAT